MLIFLTHFWAVKLRLDLWEKYKEDSRPLIEQIKDHPQKFHKEKMTSGRYKGQFFQTVYNKEGYLVVFDHKLGCCLPFGLTFGGFPP